MQVLTQAAERSEPYDSMPAPKDAAARASMPVLARTTVHAISHDGGIFVSILHLLPYLQAVLLARASAAGQRGGSACTWPVILPGSYVQGRILRAGLELTALIRPVDPRERLAPGP
jgi:hypothetical protein